MKILVTGASGRLGQSIVNKLKYENIDVLVSRRGEDLSEIPWYEISTIINCAACTPAPGLVREDYIEGNVIFLQRLLAFCSDKQFIHFGSLSEFYRFDDYQYTKMLGSSILSANKHRFKDLAIYYLPTLEDEALISSIVSKAARGVKPIVNELIYSFMTYREVADFVVDCALGNSSSDIAEYFQQRNLYEMVIERVAEGEVVRGEYIDRRCLNESWINISCELYSSN